MFLSYFLVVLCKRVDGNLSGRVHLFQIRDTLFPHLMSGKIRVDIKNDN